MIGGLKLAHGDDLSVPVCLMGVCFIACQHCSMFNRPESLKFGGKIKILYLVNCLNLL